MNTRKCGHPLGSTSWCPDCELAEARKNGEFPSIASRNEPPAVDAGEKEEQLPKFTMDEWKAHARKHKWRFDIDTPAEGTGAAALPMAALPTYRPVRLAFGVTMHRDVVPNEAGWLKREDVLTAIASREETPAVDAGVQPVNRGDAVNLARTMLKDRDCKGITTYGVRVLCEAVMTMDAALSTSKRVEHGATDGGTGE